MKRTKQMTMLVMALLVFGHSIATGQTPIGTEFTFQGRLQDNGQPANGDFDLNFTMWDSDVGGSQAGSTIILINEPVSDGIFSVELDFGPNAFDKNRRWIQIEVDNIPLTPRQAISGSPHSIESRGIYVNDSATKVGIGREANLTTSQVFGVYKDTVPNEFGGMYVETNAAGKPFYGYSVDNNVSAYHYYESSTGDWNLFNAGDRLTVRNDGFVGINRDVKITTSETFGIYKDTVGTEFGGMYAETNPNGRPFYGYAIGGVAQAYTYFDDATDGWRIYNGGDRMVVLDNGNVGVGYVAPSFKFQVNGECAKPGGGSWASSSDRRLKKNIKDLDGSLEKLLKLRGVTFEYLDPNSINELEGERVGVIAQEVEKVFPDWVNLRSDGYKAVTFRGFEALAVEALRELRAEREQDIKTLKDNEIQSLQRENDELQERLESLEAVVEALATQISPRQ